MESLLWSRFLLVYLDMSAKIIIFAAKYLNIITP